MAWGGFDLARKHRGEIPDATRNLHQVFDRLDSNGDGSIDVREVASIRRAMERPQPERHALPDGAHERKVIDPVSPGPTDRLGTRASTAVTTVMTICRRRSLTVWSRSSSGLAAAAFRQPAAPFPTIY